MRLRRLVQQEATVDRRLRDVPDEWGGAERGGSSQGKSVSPPYAPFAVEGNYCAAMTFDLKFYRRDHI